MGASAEANPKMDKLAAPGSGVVSTWAKEAWTAVLADMVKMCFIARRPTLNLDSSEDHEWCKHTFGKDCRNLFTEQRHSGRNHTAKTLSLVQLAVVPNKVPTSNPNTDAASQVVNKMLKNPTGGDESTHGEDSDSDIEELDMVNLVEKRRRGRYHGGRGCH